MGEGRALRAEGLTVGFAGGQACDMTLSCDPQDALFGQIPAGQLTPWKAG